MLFGIIFAVLTLVFVIGIIMSKSKEVDYSEAITDEIEEIKAQPAILDENYDLDFDLDEQYRIRDHWQQALKNKDILEEKRQYIEGRLNDAKGRHDELQSTVENVKDELYLSSKISNDLIVDSISTMANIKALDQHISDLNQQRQQLVQELDTFYNHAEAVTKSQFVYFNKLSLFHDVQQWLKSAEDTNENGVLMLKIPNLLQNELKSFKCSIRRK